MTSICDYGVAMVTDIIIKNFNVHTRLLIRGEQIHYKSIFESNLDAHQQTNGQGSCGTYTPWNITQPLKRIHLNQF